ncbi:hypothetical protein, partial [Pseudarthrobacter sp. YAF2]|uniref:hypothetical protein n=1 Tax=Pseudarthrobacter sp. YAF2 TaxID=3233078 RepID=UPI003F974B1C
QYAPDLRRDRHLLRHHRHPRPRNNTGSIRIPHRSPGFQTSDPGLHLTDTGQDFQAPIRQPRQRISNRKRLRTTPVDLSKKHGKGSTDILKRPHHRRFPHTPIITKGYDI